MRLREERTRRVLAPVLAVALVAGCTGGPVGQVRRTAPGRPVEPDPSVESRPARLPLPPAAVPHQIEFLDAARGYVLVADFGGRTVPGEPAPDPSGPNPTNLLFGTADGGRSWQRLRHPHPAGFQQLYAGNDHLVLWVEPARWYVSGDAGRTFQRHLGERAPAGYHRTQGVYQVCCDDDESPTVVRWTGEGRRSVPAQPPVPGLRGVAYAGDRLLAAGLADGRAYPAVSPDGGRSWPIAGLPALGGGLSGVLPMMAADGDAWLVGHAGDRTRFPRLWRQAGAGEPPGWVPADPVNPPERFVSAVPLGAGRLAVTSPRGVGLIERGRYAQLPWPVGGHYLRVLDDGTLFAAHPPSGEVWLGLGSGTDRRWVALRLTG
ncbi:hypothetical protein ABNF97_04940 [Plantactinospora sp. B6F1]|uniref:hypothetical protein n=1 Tax=Plantactinospora sp. B6F1 TaxID=3158971 RepID=UPI0032D98F8B